MFFTLHNSLFSLGTNAPTDSADLTRCNFIMRILNLNEELQQEEFPSRSVEEFLRVNATDAHWLVNDVFHRKHLAKTQMKTVLVALHEGTSTKETFDVISSLFVQYFTCGNYGFVKLVSLNDPVWKDFGYLIQLVKEAVCFLNEVSFQLQVLLLLLHVRNPGIGSGRRTPFWAKKGKISAEVPTLIIHTSLSY